MSSNHNKPLTRKQNKQVLRSIKSEIRNHASLAIDGEIKKTRKKLISYRVALGASIVVNLVLIVELLSRFGNA